MKQQQKRSVLQAEGFFPSEKRWLFYRYWNVSPRNGEILAIHGAAEHGGRYRELGAAFAARGYNFYVLDLTGHGRSEGKRGYIQQFDDYLVDIGNFYAFLRNNKNMRNPFILGHSMGGLLAILFVAMGQCFTKGLILSGPLLKLKLHVPLWKKVMTSMLNQVYPTFSIANSIEPAALTHDYEVIEDYKTDPFIYRKITARWFCELLKTMKEAQKSAPYIDVPCLILHGEDDTICDKEGSRAFFKELASPRKELYTIRSCYHEVFNESFREQILEKVFQWLKKIENPS